MQLPHVTIIVLNYNGISDTRKCVRSLLRISYPYYSIVVIDNGSKENEAKLLSKSFTDPRVEVIRSAKNLGFTEGNNRILRTVKAPYVVLINNDVIVTPSFLEPIIRAMESDKTIAVSQPKILWARNKKYFDYAGACGGYLDAFGYPFTRGRVFNSLEQDKGQYNEVSDIFWASGAAMIIRTTVFKKIGYFDTRFFNYMEEIDLCFRINKAGHRIVCIPTTHVFHKGAATSSKNELKKRYWEHRNNLLMITKNFEFVRLLYTLPIRFVLEYLSIVYYLANKRTDYAAAVILSQLSYFHMAPGILFERLTKHKKKQYTVGNRMFGKSIVLHYFLLKRRTFAALMQ